ncbi:hypothetical protein SAMN04488515_1602 [Cognatiyoonia koreensis]|uniref:Uncharacterized protein n=1 Tax=Cognatiyoonia koreensis TaxID=364200 RepID=A0A1I0Q1T1_9RHOB|nr:hypothetical protein [Cognatiyoonia koreensis]SEW20835.1 hypothetical protein SAMN04488515_1602 [Cognatiyoonia koreensis]
MKMKIGTALPDDYTVEHSDLAESAATLIAHALLPLFAENMSEDIAKANVEGIVTELAYLFDDGEIQLGGKTYRPRLAFVDEDGQVLPGAAALDNFHALADAPFDIAPEAKITFEEAIYDAA